MNDLQQIIGREVPLDQFHLTVRRVAKQFPGVTNFGACLVTCSDERQGTLRGGFERDIANSLISDVSNARDRVFAVSNLCGRLEPGAFALVDNHFTRPAVRGPKLLIFEIASHVGRIKADSGYEYGQVERFGQRSPCCGALTVLLEPRQVTGTVRHPWFEQLNAFFGPVRLAALRKIRGPDRLVAAAVVHAALQAESAVAEVFNDPPPRPTEILLLSGVAVNQQWADGFLPVSWHHLRAEAGRVDIVGGFSLRTTPEALQMDLSGPRIRVAGGHVMEDSPRVPRRAGQVAAAASATTLAATSLAADELAEVANAEEALAALAALPQQEKDAMQARIETVREQVESIRHDPAAWRSYSRPILRGLFRGLCVAQPELGLAAVLFEGGEKLFSAHKLRQLVKQGPATAEGRRALHDIEAELQQLNHEDAQRVLDLLLAKKP